MTYEPIAANLAVELTRVSVGSARPDAPVVPDERARPARLAAARVCAWPAACAPSPAGSSPAGDRQGLPAQLSGPSARLGRPGILGLPWPR